LQFYTLYTAVWRLVLDYKYNELSANKSAKRCVIDFMLRRVRNRQCYYYCVTQNYVLNSTCSDMLSMVSKQFWMPWCRVLSPLKTHTIHTECHFCHSEFRDYPVINAGLDLFRW